MKECQSIHLYIFRTPFHWWWPISICSAVVQLKVYFKVQLTSGFFCCCCFWWIAVWWNVIPIMLKTQEDLFHEYFIFSLFVTVSIMSCISELGCLVDSPDMTRGALRLSLTTMDSLLVSPRFDSWQRICKKKQNKTKQKTLQMKCYTQSSFTILAHVFLTISGRFCVKLMLI